MKMITLVETTVANKRDAQKIARELVKEHRAACVTIAKIESVYHWKGKIVDENEFLLSCKTDAAHAKTLQQAIARVHPYEVPMILTSKVEANDAYASWICRRAKTKHIK